MEIEKRKRNPLYDGVYIRLGTLFAQSLAGEDFRVGLEKALAEDYPINYRYRAKGSPLLYDVLNVNSPELYYNNSEEYCKSIAFMLDHGADVNVIDDFNWNGLMYICYGWSAYSLPLFDDLFSRIIYLTENINQKGYDRFAPVWEREKSGPDYTALSLAADSLFLAQTDKTHGEDPNTCWGRIKLLIEAGIDCNIEKEFSNETRLYYLPDMQEKYNKIVNQIKEYKEYWETVKNLSKQDESWEYER